MKRILGVLAVLFGVSILGWIGYNVFIERSEENRMRRAGRAVVVSGVMIGVGIKWLRDEG